MRMHLDFETYSECSLKNHGAWVYSKHPSTKVLCAAWAYDDGFVYGATYEDTDQIKEALRKAYEQGVEFHAFNSFFECCIIANVLDMPELIDFNRWHDTMALACAACVPQSLEGVTSALPFEKDQQKSNRGKKLIQLLCKPQKAPKKRGEPDVLITPEEKHGDEYHELMSEFLDYCKQDVVAEREVHNVLLPLSAVEREVWIEDQRMNWRGMKVDVGYAKRAFDLYQEAKKRQLAEIKQITGLKNPNSAKQLLEWFNDRFIELPNTQSETLRVALKDETGYNLTDEERRVLELRLTSARIPPAKYKSMIARACREDHRARGISTYHAASTGRPASRGINTMNLPRPAFKDYSGPVDLINLGDYDSVSLFHDDVIDVCCSGIRPALIADDGHRFIDSDYSSVEGRVVRWLAGARDDLAKIVKADERGDSSFMYKVAAEGVFGIPATEVEKGTDEYQGGKATELACGYQGSVGAVNQMAENMGMDLKIPTVEEFKAMMTPEELDLMRDKVAGYNKYLAGKNKPPLEHRDQFVLYLVTKWRLANPEVVNFWYACEDAAKTAILNPGEICKVNDKIQYRYGVRRGLKFLWCQLPSGRVLSYYKPWVDREGSIKFWGIDSTTRKWCVLDTYGGKLVENNTQAVARDIMCQAVVGLRGTPYENVVLTVYDQIVSEVPNGVGSPEEMSELMCRLPAWAEGLPLKAEGGETLRFWKD